MAKKRKRNPRKHKTQVARPAPARPAPARPAPAKPVPGQSASARPASARPAPAQPARSLRAFLGLTLLWLAPMFAVWYWLGAYSLIPVAGLSQWVLTNLYPHAIASVELSGRVVDIVTHFNYVPTDVAVPEGKTAQYAFSLNGLKYGYGLPLLLALLLASPGRWLRRLLYALLGYVLIVLVQVWGISFETLIALIFRSPQEFAEQMGSSAFSRELIALGYQLGFLILPAVSPLIFWGLSHYAYLQTLIKPQPKQTANV